MDGLVSIIMPNYNCEKYIGETLNSVMNQTYENWELLIVDDCSDDNSLQVIGEFMKRDARIKLFVNEKGSGAAASRNRAIREAKGKWIAFLDSDDLWTEDKLEKQVKFMADNGYHFSCTDYEHIDENSNPLNVRVTGPKKVTRHKMFNYCYLGCLTVMYDAELTGLIQIPDTITKRNDYALWLKISKFAVCYRLSGVYAYYRSRKGSLSHQSKLSLIKYHYRLFKNSEGMCAVKALFYTCKNLFHGVFKKLRYVKKIKVKKQAKADG
ncbi:MAG: glycosyltransferase family 2 protein [Roseburia sp.]|nr:glycosyltransferase family 2 protein [Roseburia sp.]